MQHVRAPTGRQCRTLLDPEPVLLVHDRDPEVAEVDALLDQRVRPDDDLRGLDVVLDGTGQQRDRNAELRADRVDGQEVLLGKCLGRRHQRPSLACLDGPQERVEGDAVFPEPTSPWRRRSIGRSPERSPSISPIALSWLGVSSNGRTPR